VNEVPITGIMLDQYQQCNYIPNVVRGLSQRQNKRGSFTIWENVQQDDLSMCGTYISYWDMHQNSLKNLTGHLPIAFRVTIQYDQLIMFENFYEFINTIYVNVKLKLRVSLTCLYGTVLFLSNPCCMVLQLQI
jgi:hypothetical protein